MKSNKRAQISYDICCSVNKFLSGKDRLAVNKEYMKELFIKLYDSVNNKEPEKVQEELKELLLAKLKKMDDFRNVHGELIEEIKSILQKDEIEIYNKVHSKLYDWDMFLADAEFMSIDSIEEYIDNISCNIHHKDFRKEVLNRIDSLFSEFNISENDRIDAINTIMRELILVTMPSKENNLINSTHI